MKHPIAITQNGKEVFADLVHSAVAATLSQQPHMATLVKEALRSTNLTGTDVKIEQDMQRVIGYDVVVETPQADSTTIFYAKLLHEDVFSRFIMNGQPKTTQHLSIVLRASGNQYELMDVWMGKQRPARPGSANETSASQPYWSKHAYALEGQHIQTRTLTRTDPYTAATATVAIAVA